MGLDALDALGEAAPIIPVGLDALDARRQWPPAHRYHQARGDACRSMRLSDARLLNPSRAMVILLPR